MCYLATKSKLVHRFVPNREPPQQAVPPESKCSDLMANRRKVTAFADWPCNVLGRLPIGDKLPSSGHGGDPAAMVDLMVVSSVHGWGGGSRRPATFLRIL